MYVFLFQSLRWEDMQYYMFSCFWLKTEPKKRENSGKNIIKYYIIYVCVYVYVSEYYKVKKQNGNECTELEGGLNATH